MRVNGAFAAHHLHLGEHARVIGGIVGNVAKVSDAVALAGARSTKGLVCEFTSPLFIALTVWILVRSIVKITNLINVWSISLLGTAMPFFKKKRR
jgi:hypothetical protein